MRNYLEYLKCINACETKEEKQLVNDLFENKEIINEGLLSRILTKTSGTKSQLATMLKNVPVAMKAIRTGSLSGLQNPKAKKQKVMVLQRTDMFLKKIIKVYSDYTADLELLFGEGLENMPSSTKQSIKKADENLEKFLTDMKKIKSDITNLINNPSKNKQEKQPEPNNSQELEPNNSEEPEVN